MPEIGATLREARMRAKIDVSEVEAETKIRAKYLRALENEEWDLLPGPTYARSFLRTYADFLGLDSKLLVEEYRIGQDRVPEHDLPPLASHHGRRAARGRAPGGRAHHPGAAAGPGGRERIFSGSPGRGTLVVLGIVLVIVLVSVVNLVGGGSGGPEPGAPVAQQRSGGSGGKSGAARTVTAAHRHHRHRAKLRLIPTGDVYVCLQDAKGTSLVNGQTLTAGSPTPTFRSKRFTVRLGNANVELEVDGHRHSLTPSATPLGYRITRKGLRPLPEAQWPSCVGA